MNASMFSIQPTSPEPIYRQIVGQLHRMIVAGKLQPGEVLPSVRMVAVAHAISPMTVSRAYSLAESEGLLERFPGKGMAVSTMRKSNMTQPQRMALLEHQLVALGRQARELGLPAAPIVRRLTKLIEK